jgi:hypothetical protein
VSGALEQQFKWVRSLSVPASAILPKPSNRSIFLPPPMIAPPPYCIADVLMNAAEWNIDEDVVLFAPMVMGVSGISESIKQPMHELLREAELVF